MYGSPSSSIRRRTVDCHDGDGFELVLEFDDHALSGFAANAGNFRETGKVTGADRGDEFFDVHAGKDFESEGGANA